MSDRAYRENNKEQIKAKDKKYYQKNKDKIAVRKQLWAENNKEKTKQSKRLWEQRNPNARREKLLRYRARKANNKVFVISTKDIRNLYASNCFFCQSTNQIEADHIIPIVHGGRHSIGNLMPLCRSCNASKSNKFIMEFRIWQERKINFAKNNIVD
jgi:5-methylcytosine-specific restriction endonuclease McrA